MWAINQCNIYLFMWFSSIIFEFVFSSRPQWMLQYYKIITLRVKKKK